MSHNSTKQETPQWIDNCADDLAHAIDNGCADMSASPSKIATIIARHAPREGVYAHSLACDELAAKCQSQSARIAELEADNARLRERNIALTGALEDFVHLWDNWGAETPCMIEPFRRSFEMRVIESKAILSE